MADAFLIKRVVDAESGERGIERIDMHLVVVPRDRPRKVGQRTDRIVEKMGFERLSNPLFLGRIGRHGGVPRRSASGTGCCRAYCSDYSGRSDSDCSDFAESRWRRIERMPPTSERPTALPTAKSTEFFSTPSETSEYVRANRGKDSKKSGFRCFIGISRAHAEPANRRHDDI